MNIIFPFVTVVSLLFVPLLTAQDIFAASFDCAKAASPMEKTICADPGLSDLDGKLGEAYRQALAKAPDQAALRTAQRDWLKRVNTCNGPDCLKQAYETRIAELLNSSPSSTPGEKSPPSSIALNMSLENPATPGDSQPISAITENILKNMTYDNMPLKNGFYELNESRAEFSEYIIGKPEPDGSQEAAVCLATGDFPVVHWSYDLYLVRLSQGKVRVVGSKGIGPVVGGLKFVSLKAGLIEAISAALGPNDPACCPSLKEKCFFKMINGQLEDVNKDGGPLTPVKNTSPLNNPALAPTILLNKTARTGTARSELAFISKTLKLYTFVKIDAGAFNSEGKVLLKIQMDNKDNKGVDGLFQLFGEGTDYDSIIRGEAKAIAQLPLIHRGTSNTVTLNFQKGQVLILAAQGVEGDNSYSYNHYTVTATVE